MKIALAGSSGNFGKLALELFRKGGHYVKTLKWEEWRRTDFSHFDVCFLSIPVMEIGKYIENCGSCKVVEISSVKEPVRKFKSELISIHPIFGPRSFSNPEYRNIVYVDDLSIHGGEDVIRELFPECNLVHMTADEHDKAMVEVLVRPFLLSRIASDTMGKEGKVTGPSQVKLQELAAISGSESSGILMDTIKLNPYAKEAIAEINKVSKWLESELSR